MIIFLYVDDCGIESPDISEIDAFIDRLEAKGFELTEACDFSIYLGIKFHRNLKNNTITMTQPGLSKKVVEATCMTLCSPNKTPTSQTDLAQILKDLQSRKIGSIHLWLECTLCLYQHKTRYYLCSQPSSLVHFQSQAVPCISCQDDHQVPLWNLQSKHHPYSYHILQD